MSVASIKKLENKILYIAPNLKGNVDFQYRNLGLPVQEVSQDEFLSRVYGDYSGFLCVFQKTSTDIKRNVFYRKNEREQLEKFLHKTFGTDTYVSYSTYNSKKKVEDKALRTQENIVQTYMLVQDLDYYKFGISDAEFLQGLAEMIKDEEIICPSYIVSSGRGYQLIWLIEPFKNIKNYTNDKNWRNIQNHLFDKLKGFNSDSVVKNPSAVVRLAGSKHRKTGNKVYGYLSNLKIFNLNDFLFFHDISPLSDRKVAPPKQKPKKQRNKAVTRLVENWSEYTLNRQREHDIFIFVSEQNKRGVPYHAKRNWLALVLAFHALASSEGDKDYAAQRVKDLCYIMDLSETSEDEIIRRSVTPAIKYYEDWVNKTWDQEKYVQGGLFYKNQTMIELMGIKDDYYIQWKMKTIKIKNKAYEAARKRFEKFGVEEAENHTWESYQERRNEKLAEEKEDKLWLLQKALEKSPKATQKELAQMLGVNQSTISRLKKSIL